MVSGVYLLGITGIKIKKIAMVFKQCKALDGGLGLYGNWACASLCHMGP
jgi:hypothetical protein